MARTNDPFSGIRLKRSRAWDQINGLKPDIKAFLDGDPYRPRIDFNNTTGVVTLSIHTVQAPDPMWGVRIGEVIHKLRSALDHVVWELVILNTGKPPAKDSPSLRQSQGFSTEV